MATSIGMKFKQGKEYTSSYTMQCLIFGSEHWGNHDRHADIVNDVLKD